jgi:hypothetical protein
MLPLNTHVDAVFLLQRLEEEEEKEEKEAKANKFSTGVSYMSRHGQQHASCLQHCAEGIARVADRASASCRMC